MVGEPVGGHHPVVWGVEQSDAKKLKKTIHGGIYWPPIGGPKHNNQPKTGGIDGGEHGGDMRQAGRVGEA